MDMELRRSSVTSRDTRSGTLPLGVESGEADVYALLLDVDCFDLQRR